MPKLPLNVIPAYAGIHPRLAILDPGVRRDDSCSPAGLQRRLVCAAGLAALAAPGLATEPAANAAGSVAPPSEVAGSVASARMQGSGRLRFFGLLVYDARLWVGAGFEPHAFEAHAFALELQYARKFEGTEIAQRSIVEMRRTGSMTDSQAQAWQAAMTRAFPNVVAADRLTGVHAPGEATRFFHNGRATAAVPDPMFARAFFGIWLAPTTSEPELRRQLIGPLSQGNAGPPQVSLTPTGGGLGAARPWGRS